MARRRWYRCARPSARAVPAPPSCQSSCHVFCHRIGLVIHRNIVIRTDSDVVPAVAVKMPIPLRCRRAGLLGGHFPGGHPFQEVQLLAGSDPIDDTMAVWSRFWARADEVAASIAVAASAAYNARVRWDMTSSLRRWRSDRRTGRVGGTRPRRRRDASWPSPACSRYNVIVPDRRPVRCVCRRRLRINDGMTVNPLPLHLEGRGIAACQASGIAMQGGSAGLLAIPAQGCDLVMGRDRI